MLMFLMCLYYVFVVLVLMFSLCLSCVSMFEISLFFQHVCVFSQSQCNCVNLMCVFVFYLSKLNFVYVKSTTRWKMKWKDVPMT
jgi:hypothetical protein